MDSLQNLLQGFADVWTPEALTWCLIGVFIGTLVGALPGLGPVAGIALLLPLSFSLETVPALMLLMGVYQGSMYGGRISSILINVPGEPSAVVTAFDGYPMTKQGRGGYALSLSALASFCGGTVGFLGLVFLMPYVSRLGLAFGPPEFFALMVFALLATGGLGGSNVLKGLVSIGLGLVISVIGMDPVTGDLRLTFGSLELWEGISFVAVAVGLFGLSEVFTLVGSKQPIHGLDQKIRFKELLPGLTQVRRNAAPIARGSLIGYFVGVLPGAGSTIATFLSYSAEKRISRRPEEFGQGAEAGLSAPEAADNASIGGALVPLFTLGIPGSAITAILLGGLVTVGLQPGPRMMAESGDVIWPVIAGLFIANIMLLLLNTAFVPAFAKLITLAQPYLAPMIAALCVVGIYMVNYRFFDVGVMLFFGVLGYFLRSSGFPLAPLILGVVLGPLMELSLRQSLLISGNEGSIFFTRPISLTLLVLSALVLAVPVFQKALRRAPASEDAAVH